MSMRSPKSSIVDRVAVCVVVVIFLVGRTAAASVSASAHASAHGSSASASASSSTDEFCKPALCAGMLDQNGSPVRHIACLEAGQHQQSLESTCPSDAIPVTLTLPQQQMIVNQHNAFRNTVANGELPNFQASKRMAEMAWCDKLAYVASRNAARCEFKHDLCRNTDDFPHSGQNIASVSLSSGYRVDNDAIVQMIKMWSDESPDCPSDVIQAFRMPPAGAKQIGHFTQMVHGNCDRLGCALIRYHKSGEYYDTYLVCNYGETNMLREIVYEVGDTASACPDGKRSTKYSGLCRNAYARYDVAAATATAEAAASNGGAHASASSSNSVESTTAPSSGVVSVQVSTRTTPTSIVTTRTERHADGSVHTTVTTKAIKQQVVYVSSRSQSFVSTTTSSSNVFGNNNVVRSFSHKRTNL